MGQATAVSPAALAEVFNPSGDYFVVVRADGRVEAASDRFWREVIGSAAPTPANLADGLPASDADRLRAALEMAAARPPATIELAHPTSAGPHTVQYCLFPSPEAADLILGIGRPIHKDVSLADRLDSLGQHLSQMRRQVETLGNRIAEEAPVDRVTALPGRHEFERLLAREWHRAARLRLALGLAALDIDGLRTINDQFGSGAGDRLLREVGEFLRLHSRRYDLLARLEDDLFVVTTIHRPEDADPTADLAARLCRTIAETPFDVGADQPARITVSLGAVTMRPAHQKDAEPSRLLDAAREALRQAKQAGGNRVVVLKRETGPRQDANAPE